MSEITVNTRRIKLPFKASEEKPYIFASYGHNDKEKVFLIFKQLYEMGYNVWYDEGIEINTAYDNVIASHVKECDVFVLFVSRQSVTRPYVTENELGYAVRLGKSILPLYIEDEVELPPGVDMLLKGLRYNSTNEIIAKIKQLGIKCYGKRKAKETEREIPQGWMDEEEENEDNITKKNLVGCLERPYAYIGIHPEERSAARAYIKELYNAGYNVRSFEYSDERERMYALASTDCVAFVPVLTKKYVESGMFEADVKMAINAGKEFIGLMVNQRDRKESEENVSMPQNLSMLLGGKQMLSESERTSEGFLTELENALEKCGCCNLDDEGNVQRRTFKITGFMYDFTEDGKAIILTRYNGSDIDVVINETYGGFPVVEIGKEAFMRCSRLRSVSIPNSVIRINDSAFASCRDLVSVSISDSVTSIGEHVFADCTSLVSITIPDSVTYIGPATFLGCRELKSVKLSNHIDSISGSMFDQCRSLASIIIPDCVTEIGETSFAQCSSLVSVTIPDGVTRICGGAFLGCRSLVSIIIPDCVSNIGRDALATGLGYADGAVLEHINIRANVTKEYNEKCNNLTVYCSTDSYAWGYCEKNEIPHKTKHLDDALTLVETVNDENSTDLKPSTERNSRVLISIIIALLVLAIAAGVQLSGLFDILGLLKGLFG